MRRLRCVSAIATGSTSLDSPFLPLTGGESSVATNASNLQVFLDARIAAEMQGNLDPRRIARRTTLGELPQRLHQRNQS